MLPFWELWIQNDWRTKIQDVIWFLSEALEENLLPFSDSAYILVWWSYIALTSASIITSYPFPLLALPQHHLSISFSPRWLFLLILHSQEHCLWCMSQDSLYLTRGSSHFMDNPISIPKFCWDDWGVQDLLIKSLKSSLWLNIWSFQSTNNRLSSCPAIALTFSYGHTFLPVNLLIIISIAT